VASEFVNDLEERIFIPFAIGIAESSLRELGPNIRTEFPGGSFAGRHEPHPLKEFSLAPFPGLHIRPEIF
jgi:hypothetical protein